MSTQNNNANLDEARVNPSIKQIRRLHTFGRSANKSCRPVVRQIIRELMKVPSSEISNPQIKIQKALEFFYTFGEQGSYQNFSRQLERRFPSEILLPIIIKFQIAIGQFDTGVRIARDLNLKFPDNPNFIAILVTAFLAAGKPYRAINTIKSNAQILLFGRSPFKKQMANILIAQNQINWLKDNFPSLVSENVKLTKYLQHSQNDEELPKVKTYCISLKRDQKRLSTTRAFFNSGKIDFHVVDAIEGGQMTPALISDIVPSYVNHRKLSLSEIGCSLSHMLAWKRVLDECKQDEYALVIEDDARFIYGDARGLHAAVEASKRHSIDLTFINNRACGPLEAIYSSKKMDVERVDDLFHTGNKLNYKHSDTGWGAEGYLLNGQGAESLLKIWEEFGLICALDWQLALMSLSTFKNLSQNRPIYRQMIPQFDFRISENPDFKRINSGVYHESIMTSTSTGYSSINLG